MSSFGNKGFVLPCLRSVVDRFAKIGMVTVGSSNAIQESLLAALSAWFWPQRIGLQGQLRRHQALRAFEESIKGTVLCVGCVREPPWWLAVLPGSGWTKGLKED